jgi:hypothetical protein
MSLPTISPGKTRVGWIGTGVMGSSMAGHLMTAGFSATVYNRRKEKAEPLLAKGAKWAASPRAVAEASDVVFAIVGFPSDVRQVMLSARELNSASLPNRTWIKEHLTFTGGESFSLTPRSRRQWASFFMAACYRCRRPGKRACRHTRPKPCRCSGIHFPPRRGSRAAGFGACEAHPDHWELMMQEFERPRFKGLKKCGRK